MLHKDPENTKIELSWHVSPGGTIPTARRFIDISKNG